MKTWRNPERWGGLGVAKHEKVKPLGVQCHHCRDEVHYSLTVFHVGYPEISCSGCKRKGYMMRDAREGGKLIWFRVDPPGDSEIPSMNAEVSHRDRERQPAADQPSERP
jgi:hypothetical protein